MSMQTWKEEFYPTDAGDSTDNEVDALKHSIRKWNGLTQENLDKHGIYRSFGTDMADGLTEFGIDSNSCALCILHNNLCENCIVDKQGKYGCLNNGSCFGIWYEDEDPKPMIKLLEACLVIAEKGAGIA